MLATSACLPCIDVCARVSLFEHDLHNGMLAMQCIVFGVSPYWRDACVSRFKQCNRLWLATNNLFIPLPLSRLLTSHPHLLSCTLAESQLCQLPPPSPAPPDAVAAWHATRPQVQQLHHRHRFLSFPVPRAQQYHPMRSVTFHNDTPIYPGEFCKTKCFRNGAFGVILWIQSGSCTMANVQWNEHQSTRSVP